MKSRKWKFSVWAIAGALAWPVFAQGQSLEPRASPGTDVYAEFDRLEHVRSRGEEWMAYDAEAWYGGPGGRLVLKADGELAHGKLGDSATQLLWRRAVSGYWSTELGVRLDYGDGMPSRKWLALGIKGLALDRFELDATAYVGAAGRTAVDFSAEYDIPVGRRVSLQPRLEVNVHGKDDERRGIGSGVSDGTVGLRLRYEIASWLRPYIGVEWTGKFGRTAGYAREAGERPRATRYVAGLSAEF
ncbi:copper resistance protein B [Pusillimonas sp.]|uniref:copper resistance protein B n=1 Tax=Pusillimonas sp. TaxID=3040095 RepID=UPI0029AF27B3|nr:copper resistance protein B [Pusillimonas sp.]MDX3893387.1 copper resistance protein B [Pusillimonas sp.]